MGLCSIRHYVPFGIQSFEIMSFGDKYVVRVYVVGGYIAQVHALRDYDVRQNVLIKQVFLSWHSLILFFLVSIWLINSIMFVPLVLFFKCQLSAVFKHPQIQIHRY